MADIAGAARPEVKSAETHGNLTNEHQMWPIAMTTTDMRARRLITTKAR